MGNLSTKFIISCRAAEEKKRLRVLTSIQREGSLITLVDSFNVICRKALSLTLGCEITYGDTEEHETFKSASKIRKVPEIGMSNIHPCQNSAEKKCHATDFIHGSFTNYNNLEVRGKCSIHRTKLLTRALQSDKMDGCAHSLKWSRAGNVVQDVIPSQLGGTLTHWVEWSHTRITFARAILK